MLYVLNEADGYLYYAELDDEGDFRPSEAKVGIDDPLGHGIQKNLQRSAACRAKIQAERIAHGYARQPQGDTSTVAAKTLAGDPDFVPCTAAAPCDVYVVMVGFEDQASDSTKIYSDYDQPWGYPMALFNQFFNGGYDNVPAYTGTIAHTTADTTNNLTVFGSLRAYFHQVHGEDILRFHILNDCEDGCAAPDDQPIWIQLPETKEKYANTSPTRFWTVAESMAVVNLTLPADFPYQNAPAATQLANKVLYLYAGATSTSGKALHPRVNRITRSTTVLDSIGARYVMGERQGFSSTSHSVDRFAGIGLHVHEIGHLFGFNHPNGTWNGTNPHTGQTTQTTSASVRFRTANLSGWGTMQSGAHGPPITSPRGYTFTHRACPAPYNPFYRMDLGWNTRHDITATTLDQRIDPSPDDFYVVPGANGQYYILEFRTAANFGQYTETHQFTSPPGLLIWRRAPAATNSNPMIVPADGRSISDARPRPFRANPAVSIPQDRLSDPFGAIAQLHGPTVTQATDTTHLRHETIGDGGNRDPGASHLAFRNIRNNGDHALVDIYTNYWSGPITGSVTWSDTVYVGGDITVPVGATLTISPGTLVRFTANSDDLSGFPFADKSVLKVNGTLVAEGTAADSITFESDAASPAAGDWEGISFSDSSVDADCKVNHAVIKHAQYGIRCSSAMPAELNHNNISQCGSGIIGLDMTSPTLQNNVLENNKTYGLYLANVEGAGEGIKNNTMRNNGTGLLLSSSSVHIYNSTIDNNTNGAFTSKSIRPLRWTRVLSIQTMAMTVGASMLLPRTPCSRTVGSPITTPMGCACTVARTQ